MSVDRLGRHGIGAICGFVSISVALEDGGVQELGAHATCLARTLDPTVPVAWDEAEEWSPPHS